MEIHKTRILTLSLDPDSIHERFDLDLCELQKATNPKMAHFLLNEWKPHILVIDKLTEAFNLLNNIRETFPFESLGIVYIDHSYSLDNERKCFKSGCDYYLINPTQQQLLFRINILEQRLKKEQDTKKYIFGGIELLSKERSFKKGDEIINLSPLHFRLLSSFFKNPDTILSRKWLLDNVWIKKKCSPRSIDAQISKLKNICPELNIVNVYSEGYKLETNNTKKLLKIA